MPDRVRVTRLAVAAGVLVAIFTATLFLVRPVPAAERARPAAPARRAW
jgi:hypothetical protein